MLESVLGEDLYFQVISKIGRYEIEGKFTLPIANFDILGNLGHDKGSIAVEKC